MTYLTSNDFSKLLQSGDKKIVKISPKGYALSNGIDYCYVGLKSNDGTHFLMQAYGKDARELYEEAITIYNTANSRNKFGA